MYQAKALKFEPGSLEGISQKTMEIHHGKLYQGYVDKFNEVTEKLKSADKATANQSFSEWRGLKKAESFCLDGIILHELYFGNLGADGFLGELEIGKAIIEQFGSLDEFKANLTATGMASRGWAVVAVDPLDQKMGIYACDYHDQGGIWGAVPFLVLDVYEHAYMIDFGSDRKSYIEAFWKNLDWKEIDQRWQNILIKSDR